MAAAISCQSEYCAAMPTREIFRIDGLRGKLRVLAHPLRGFVRQNVCDVNDSDSVQ
jgi:hypothetical protein